MARANAERKRRALDGGHKAGQHPGVSLHRFARFLPVSFFLLVTFAVSWGLPVVALIAYPPVLVEDLYRLPLLFLAVYGPMVAALLTVRLIGPQAWTDYFVRLRKLPDWRAAAGWPLLLIAMCLAAAWTAGLTLVWTPAALFVATLTLSELGWRGFLLPVLQRRLAALPAALVCGGLSGLWLLPTLILPGFPQNDPTTPLAWAALRFLAQACALSVLMTAAFNANRGSMLLMLLMAWAGLLPWALGLSGAALDALTLLLVAAAACVVAVTRGSALSGHALAVARLY